MLLDDGDFIALCVLTAGDQQRFGPFFLLGQ